MRLPSLRLPLFLERMLPVFVVLLIFAVYGAALQGASIYDDAVEIQQLARVRLSDAWLVQLNGYYRPLRTILWITLRDSLGWFTPSALHWLNLAAHTITTSLVYALAQRFSSHAGGIAAALVFGLFPWSYEAVLWSAAVYHPLMHACGLGALLLISSHDVRVRVRIGAALLLTAALLSHELAVLYVPLAAGAALLRRSDRVRRSDFVPAFIAACVFVLLKIFVPPTTATSIDADVGRITQNLVILLQGPAAPLIVLLRGMLGVLGLPSSPQREFIVVGLASAALVLSFTSVLLQRRWLSLWLTGAAIWLLFSTAIAGSLSVSYVLTSPRMHYSGAIGLALCCAAACAALWELRTPLLRTLLVVVLAGWCVWCVRYVSLRAIESARIGAVLRTISTDLSVSPADARVLVLNFPFWNAPRYPEFLLGNEGFQIYQEGGSGPDGFLFAQHGDRRAAVLITLPVEDAGAGAFSYVPYDDRSGVGFTSVSAAMFSYIYRIEYDAHGPRVRRIAVRSMTAPMAAPNASFAVAAAASPALVVSSRGARVCDRRLLLDLEWRMVQSVPADVTVFVHVYDAHGVRLVAADADPGERSIPLAALKPGEALREERMIELPVAGDAYEVRLGLYRRSDGVRYVARGVEGVELKNGEEVLSLRSCAREQTLSVVPFDLNRRKS